MATPDDGRRRTWRFRLNDKEALEVSTPPRATEKQVRRRGRVSLVLGTLLSALFVASIALASDVDVSVVDATAPTGSVTLAPGGSGNITINLSVSGNQVGTATFKVYRDWTLSGGVFAGSNAEEFTVLPRSGGDPATTFSTTGTVSVAAGQANGTFTLAVGAFDITNSNATGAKLAARDSSTYAVTVSAPPPPSDTTPPVISYVLDPAAPDGDNGWYTSDVTLTWSVSEPESFDSLLKTGCVDQSITTDQAATSYSCSASSDGGSAGPVEVTIKRDAAPPDVSVTGVDDGATYVLGSVPDAGCSTTDALSGVKTEATLGLLGGPVGSITASCNGAEDNAGNTNSASATYSVVYGICVLYDPSKSHKAGSTVPIKLYLCDANGVNVSSASVQIQATSLKKVDNSASGVLEDSGSANSPDNNFRYDAGLDGGGGGYIFNLSTKSPSPALGQKSVLGSGTWKLGFTVDGVDGYAVAFDVR